MLSRRTIELRPGAPGLPQTLITRENLIDCGQVNQVLEQAKAQAEELLSHAHAASEALLKKAHGEFWQQANAQLSHWQLEHRALCQGIESSASTVVNQALLQLLDEVPQPARIAALLAHLLRAQCPPANATLRCHPQALEPVRQWLGTRPDNHWQLQTDERLDSKALVLVTACEDLRIDWATAIKALLIPAPTDGTDHGQIATES
ncbi:MULTISPECIES: type III secretion system stator protein SctL [unclassified Pseudomonas]|uniref:type III secretion system stator protein SctL n=1 Tax=unclassified Pseudomonas TaxID=196821 RepID=UPI001C5B2ED3|nr:MULTISPECIES: type III secretion system stator protein SctL [unclassified Pseudomonas]MBW3504418.1 type III secretion system stator protein SctL [Pseudomonas sp. NKUCC02_KPG]MEC4241118.1 type III secretion system stator protein SctL [Pseudomonas sp. DSV-1]